MKKQILLLTLLFIPLLGFTQEVKQIDSIAVKLLDKMSDIIGELESCSFDLNKSVDKLKDGNIVKSYGVSKVNMSGPNKLVIRSNGQRGDTGFWYNGSYITYYSFDENNYVTLEAPDNTISMIEVMNDKYDFKFPAADFFSPTFTDDILEYFDTIKFLGQTVIDGEKCFHIMIVNENLNVQIWISNDIQMLPKKFVVIYKNENYRQYEATFTNWQLNIEIPKTVFEFIPPSNAKLISILEKS